MLVTEKGGEELTAGNKLEITEKQVWKLFHTALRQRNFQPRKAAAGFFICGGIQRVQLCIKDFKA